MPPYSAPIASGGVTKNEPIRDATQQAVTRSTLNADGVWEPSMDSSASLRSGDAASTPTAMVERVARAILRANGAEITASDEHWPDTMAHYNRMVSKYGPTYAAWRTRVNDALRNARAAIEAMREPTPKMLAAMDYNEVIDCTLAWGLGIEAALSDPHHPTGLGT